MILNWFPSGNHQQLFVFWFFFVCLVVFLLLFFCGLGLFLKKLQKISKLCLFNFLCPCDWLQEIPIWILEVWLTFTEYDSFFHMSYELSEWLINLSTTYNIRIKSVLKQNYGKNCCDMPRKILETKCDAEWKNMFHPLKQSKSQMAAFRKHTQSNGAGYNCTCQH